MKNKEFIRVTPEEAGIETEYIIRFLKSLEYHQVTMHSVILIRYGKCVFEQYYAPYEKNTLHRMFSVAKSFTSLGIGLLEAEGKLNIDDKIIKYFPDMLPKDRKVHDYLALMTIKDMLRMTTCYKETTYNKFDNKQDWVRTFFNTVPDHRAGTIFSYDSSASHTLAALIERLSGKKFLDYLREKFLDEIGFSREAYMVSDPIGVPMGGSGLMATPMDLAKVAFVVMNQGCWKQKQLLPLNYIKEATKKQVDTCIKMAVTEEKQGYGYQIWRIRNNGFAFYGMGGQLAICLPDYDLLCVTTADTQGMNGGNQFIYDSLYTEILPYLKDCDILNENKIPKDRLDKICKMDSSAKIDIKIKPDRINSTSSADINSRVYKVNNASKTDIRAELEWLRQNTCIKPLQSEFEQNMKIVDRQRLTQNMEQINGKRYKIEANDKDFTEVMFEFTDKGGSFYYEISLDSNIHNNIVEEPMINNKNEFKLPFGFGTHQRLKFPYYNDECLTSGVWLTFNTLYLKSHLIGERVGAVHIQAIFNGDNITLFMRKTEETYYNEFNGYLNGKYK